MFQFAYKYIQNCNEFSYKIIVADPSQMILFEYYPEIAFQTDQSCKRALILRNYIGKIDKICKIKLYQEKNLTLAIRCLNVVQFHELRFSQILKLNILYKMRAKQGK